MRQDGENGSIPSGRMASGSKEGGYIGAAHHPTHDKTGTSLPTALPPPDGAEQVDGTALPSWKNKEVFDAEPFVIHQAMKIFWKDKGQG